MLSVWVDRRFLNKRYGLACLSATLSLLVGCITAPPISRPVTSVVATPAISVAVTPAPNVSVSVNNVEYQIAGSTADELRDQMNQLRPEEYDAFTRWYVRWSYPRVGDGNQCTTGPVTVSLELTVTLPEWQSPEDASQALVDQWAAYLAALQVHEAGHQSIAVEAGNAIAQTMAALPAYATCDELERVADAAGEDVLEEYRRQDAQYDQDTDHGATQGARFP